MIPTMESRRHSALSALPRSMASARSTTGVARSVERRANPAVVFVMKSLRTPPIRVGSLYGKGPTDSTMPRKRRTRKKERSRQRTNAAETSASTGMA